MAALRARLKSTDKAKGSYTDPIYRESFEKHNWNLVESVNDLNYVVFFNEFCPEGIISDFLFGINNSASGVFGRTDVEMIDSSVMKKESKVKTLRACLDLIEETSKADYEKSGQGWSRAKKEKEMLLPDMKYILLHESELGESLARSRELCGFATFMITYEDGHEVLYLYEIHLKPKLQGLSLGVYFLEMIETIAVEVGVEKIMLTVFKSNERAVRWYQRLKYIVDEFSPEPRKFRDGTVKEPSYLILSLDIRDAVAEELEKKKMAAPNALPQPKKSASLEGRVGSADGDEPSAKVYEPRAKRRMLKK